MKVGNIINGFTVTDVKRVNKLNLIQFLKEVDNYLQKGYKLDVTSGRQVGLVLMVDLYKTEAASNIDVGSTDVNSTGVDSVGEQIPNGESVGVAPKEDTSVLEESVVTEKQRQDQLTKSVGEAKEALNTFTTPEQNDATVVKKTTTRSKKTAQ